MTQKIDEDMIRGLKCRICKLNITKDEAFLINYKEKTCICVYCEVK